MKRGKDKPTLVGDVNPSPLGDGAHALSFDESVWKANRKRRPFMLDYPESEAGLALEQVAQTLLMSRPSYPRPAEQN